MRQPAPPKNSRVNEARTLFEKVWAEHLVRDETPDTPAILYIDLHLIHEVTTPQAFTLLREKGLPVRRPDLTLGTMDHSTPTTPVHSFKDLEIVGEGAANQVRQMQQNCSDSTSSMCCARTVRLWPRPCIAKTS